MENMELQTIDAPMTAIDIRKNVNLIQQIMNEVMKENVHYGIVPGCKKPSLWKAGSEKLLSTFRIGIDPETYDISTPDEVKIRVKAKAFDIVTGRILGSGNGECSSGEEKYKWRKAVCDEEFDATPEDRRRIKWAIWDGKPYQTKQVRTNAVDMANTVLKMAEKRAQIGVTLRITAASDLFDQDLEDLPPGVTPADTPPPAEPKRASEKKAAAPAANTLICKVAGSDIKNGTKKDGNPFTKYTIKTDKGNFDTFSETFHAEAKQAYSEGIEVKISFDPPKDPKYNPTITAIERNYPDA